MRLLTPEELDREYNARAAIPDHPQVLARWAEQSAQARSRLRCELDYYYGASPAETLDLFPSEYITSPLLVFMHGGYWRSLDKTDFSFLAPAFTEAGVTLAVVNYGLAPRVTLDEIVRQMLRACAWLWRNAHGLGIDPDRIYVSGHSAGGHLTAMMLAAQWSTYARDLPDTLVRGGLAISGLYDLEPVARAPFLASDVQLDDAGARRLSPLSYMPSRSVPLLYTAVGEFESSEFKRQSQLIADAWPHCFVRELSVEGAHHLSVMDQFADRSSSLHAMTLRMIEIA